jgi:HK97 family phage portal protein
MGLIGSALNWIGSKLSGRRKHESDEQFLARIVKQHDLSKVSETIGKRNKGIVERVFMGGFYGSSGWGWPGGWSADRNEMAAHYRHYTYIAVGAIARTIAGLKPNIARVTVPDEFGWEGRGQKDEKVRAAWQYGHKSILRQHRYRKSLNAIQEHEEVEPVASTHPLVRLFAHPNDMDVACDLWYELLMHLELSGNAYLWVVPNKMGLPYQLCVIPSHWVWPHVNQMHDPEEGGLIDYYEIRPWIGPGAMRFPASEVIHFRYKSPVHKLDGYSPQTAGSEWIDCAESIDRARFWQFKNGSFPQGAINLGETWKQQDIGPEDLERIYALFFARSQGEGNTGRPIIMPPDAEYAPLSIAPLEMAYESSGDQMLAWVLALWGVPKEITGLQPIGSDLSWYAPLLMFFQHTINPKLQYIGEVLTSKLAHRFDESLRIWWDDHTPQSPAQINSDLQLDYQYGLRTPNEGRAIRGLPAYEHGGDDPLVNPSLAPMPLNTGESLEDMGLENWIGAPQGQGDGGGDPFAGLLGGGGAPPAPPGWPPPAPGKRHRKDVDGKPVSADKRFSKQLHDTIGPYSVYLVDGQTIRTLTQAWHEFGEVAIHEDFPDLIPDAEIWIDNTTRHDEFFFLIHTAIERYEGVDYYAALREEARLREAAHGRHKTVNPDPEKSAAVEEQVWGLFEQVEV